LRCVVSASTCRWALEIHRGPGRTARHALGQQRHRNDRTGSKQRRHADRRMKQKQRNEKNRNPRHVQERGRSHARHERAHLVQIAQGLLHQHGFHAAERQGGERNVD